MAILRSLVVILSIVVLSACMPVVPPQPTQDLDPYLTQAVQTIVIPMTIAAGETAVAQLTRNAEEEKPLPTLIPSPTPLPTSTPTPTPPPPPTNTSTPQPTETPESDPCNQAELVDAFVDPGSRSVPPGGAFTWTWRLLNTGVCAWTPNFDLVFGEGQQMDGPDIHGLDEFVAPGDTVDITFDLDAPGYPGEFAGTWYLRDENGKLFGTDPGNQPLLVVISVYELSETVYSFTDDLCYADWFTEVSQIPCPAPETNYDSGYMDILEDPLMETGREEAGFGILVVPNLGDAGYVYGRFPVRRVRGGDHFEAVIGCLDEAFECDVTFELSYAIDDRPLRKLHRWTETFNGRLRTVSVDLSDLRGRDVQFYLTVLNNGDSLEDYAVWLNPTIRR